MQYPSYVARFYDVVYAQIRTQDESFYLKKIAAAKGPVLEIGTGTGRFFVKALHEGSDIHGIDSNESMLDILKSKIDSKDLYRISLQDATRFHLEKKFELIIAPFRMFSHLVEIESQLQMLNCVYDHLQENGTCIFDLFVPDPEFMKTGFDPKIDFEGEYLPGKKLKRITSVLSDYIHQVNHVTMNYVWEEDDIEKSESWTFPMRYFFRYELEHLIARSKLQLREILGSYDGLPLTNQSKDFIVVCGR